MVVFRKGNPPKKSEKSTSRLVKYYWTIWPEVWVKSVFFPSPPKTYCTHPEKLTWLAGNPTVNEDVLPIEKGWCSNVMLVFRGITWHLNMDPSGKVLLWNHPFQTAFYVKKIQGVRALWITPSWVDHPIYWHSRLGIQVRTHGLPPLSQVINPKRKPHCFGSIQDCFFRGKRTLLNLGCVDRYTHNGGTVVVWKKYVHPLREMIQFDLRMFFKWV